MIRIALKEAKKSICTNRHGSVVVNKKSVLGQGHNTYKSHPKWGAKILHSTGQYEFTTVHAEANAIKNAISKGIDIKGATLYVTRVGGKNSKPCKSCQQFIIKYGIRKVIYTDQNGKVITTWP